MELATTLFDQGYRLFTDYFYTSIILLIEMQIHIVLTYESQPWTQSSSFTVIKMTQSRSFTVIKVTQSRSFTVFKVTQSRSFSL